MWILRESSPILPLRPVTEAVAVVKEEHVDFLLAVGGGSVIDTAKYIGVAALTEENVWDEYFLKKTPVGATLPVWRLPTIARNRKRGFLQRVS